MRNAEDILPTPDAERRRLRLRKRFRKYKKRHPRVQLSAEDMLKYLRERQIRSRSVLEQTRGPDDPNRNDFQRVFGSWGEAIRQAFGSPLAVDNRGDYMIKAVHEFDLWSVKRFRDVRKQSPDVPSWVAVKREFGTYRNLIESARRSNLKMLLTEYKKLIRRFGRPPTLEEVRASHLRMDKAIAFYGGKKQMDDFVMSMKG
jgi:hypothetical protein